MSELEQNIQVKIAQIIDRSRHHEEMFLTDSKTAAQQILKLLQNENILSFSNELTNISVSSKN